MKFAICNETYQGWDFEAACADIADSGYNAVEIAPFPLDKDPTRINENRAQKIGATAKTTGLEVSGLH